MTAVDITTSHVAPNYHPLPIVVAEASGAWVTDTGGKRYLDCLAAYSALNFGHGHPALIDAARRQLDRVTLTSRAFLHDQLEEFCAELAALAGTLDPRLTRAADEHRRRGRRDGDQDEPQVGLRHQGRARRAGHDRGGGGQLPRADDDDRRLLQRSRDACGFGPFAPGFRMVPYGDADALAAAVDATTVAVLLEPIQGEAGVVVPPPGYLAAVRRICDEHGALFVADEIQSGLGRVGTTFAVQREGVTPDAVVLGKALGGGIVPVSAVVARRDVLGVLTPGTHGSTFGGNPLACAVGRAVVALLATGEYQERARVLGARMHERLNALTGSGIVAVRGAGLWAGVDVDPALATGRQVCEELAVRGVLAKDTHSSTIRLAPPLVIAETDLEFALDQLEGALADLAR